MTGVQTCALPIWRIEDITFDRVVVTPAPGQPGKMPFWHGDRPGRPLELGRALGEFVRSTRAAAIEQPDEVVGRLMADAARWQVDPVDVLALVEVWTGAARAGRK